LWHQSCSGRFKVRSFNSWMYRMILPLLYPITFISIT
jgi:hypothetical protein